MSNARTSSRRRFLQGTAAVAAAPYFVPASALGRAGRPAPSNRIVMGCIGVGWQGGSNMNAFLGQKDCQVVAICDTDRNHRDAAVRRVNGQYKNEDCAHHDDFRDLIARDDIDAVSLGLPDHWHAIPAIAAAESGKDVFGEKPLSHSLLEGRAMCDAIQRYGRIWQTGSWQRSISNFRFACELVRNGRVGKVTRVEVGLPSGHSDFGGTKGQEAPQAPPEHLDYDRWLGPAPYAPYCPARVHKNWRWVLDHGGGQLMDWIGHHMDIAHWGMDWDMTGPIWVDGKGEFPTKGLWNSPTRYRIDARYPGDVEVVFAGGHSDIRGGTKWIGPDGWVWVNRGGIDAEPKSLLKEQFSPNEVHLFRSPGHQRNFLDCVKSRATSLTPCETAHRSASPGHLGQISMALGRKIHWDAQKEEIIGDETATRMLGYGMRAPWRI